MRCLCGTEKQQLVNIAEKIVDGPDGSMNKQGMVFVPEIIEKDKTLSLKSWASMPRSAKVFYVFVHVCADIHCNKGGYERLMGKQKQQVQNSLGRLVWTSDLAGVNSKFASKGKNTYEDWKVVSTYNGSNDPNLSKDIYKFQHYAEFSELGVSNPTAANPDISMDDAIAGTSNAEGANRDGILGKRTMQQLEAMTNSNFKRVSFKASPIATAGADLAKKLTSALSWASLDKAKMTPNENEVPYDSTALVCSTIADAILLQPGSENNPAFKDCLDRIRELRSRQQSQQAQASAINWLYRTGGKVQLPTYPGTPSVASIISKRPDLLQPMVPSKIPVKDGEEKPLPFPEDEPTTAVATSEEDLPSDGTDAEIERIKREIAEAKAKNAKAGGSSRSAIGDEGRQVALEGKVSSSSSTKWWLVGLAVVASGGLAYYLLNQNKGDRNQYGQPLQKYDEDGKAILAYNQYGNPLQQYDESGKAVPMFDLDGKQIQLYDEDDNAIAMSNYANVNVSSSNKSK